MQSSLAVLRLIPRAAIVTQSRNTWIVKRRLPLPPRPSWESEFVVGEYIKDINPPPIHPEDMDLYEMDAIQTEDQPAPQVKVILLQHVEGVGSAGEVLAVEAKVARTRLILAQKAVYADEFNLKWFKNLIDNADRSEAPSSKLSPETIKKLRTSVFSVLMNGRKPWTVNANHIRVAFRSAALVVPESSIFLPTEPIEGPDEDIQNKVFIVNVKINNKEIRPTRCVIHHTGLPLKEEWFAGHLKPIFQNDQEMLDQLPVIPKTIEETEDE